MRVTVVGAGAIGLLFAARLTEMGHEVCLITRSEGQAEKLRQSGLALDGERVQWLQKVTAHWDRGFQDGLWIVTVKQYQLAGLWEKVRQIPAACAICFTQNGMSHLEKMSELPHERLFVSSVEHGAARLNETTVRHNGIGVWKVAPFRGNSDFMRSKSEVFPIVFEQEYLPGLTEKLIKNCVINPLTAVLGCKNGELVHNPHFHRLLKKQYEEVITVFPDYRQRVPLTFVESLCEKTAENTSSMLSDLMRKQPTEVDAIVGYTLKKAPEADLPQLRFLYEAILGMEGREE